MKNRNAKKIVIVGAGPGGLSAAMILASRGHQVEVFEKSDRVGGRNAYLDQDGFRFDIGPTFLMLKPVLDEIFADAGEKVENHLHFYDLDPMYHLIFPNHSLKISPDHEKTRREIQKNFPGEELGYDRLLAKEKIRFEAAYPCLQKDYSSIYKLFNKYLLRFIPKLSFPRSMYDELGRYFQSEDLKLAFTFQSKYIGMSPMECPAAFMIIPFIEHNFGIQHVRGGLSEISVVMAKLAEAKGAKIHLNTEVAKIEKDHLVLCNGDTILADKIVVNADIGYAFKSLMKGPSLAKRKFSCSTFMLYLGIDAELDIEHHSIFFSEDYKKFLDSIFHSKNVPDDISIYVRNATVIDDTLAPVGKSNLYILVPVPNNKSEIDWDTAKDDFRDKVISRIESKIGMTLRDKIITEHVITPKDWEEKYNVFLGATFNLAHSLNQMLYFRPHNKLSKNIYLVGGGTHPGSGLPTIYESARITANLIDEK